MKRFTIGILGLAALVSFAGGCGTHKMAKGAVIGTVAGKVLANGIG